MELVLTVLQGVVAGSATWSDAARACKASEVEDEDLALAIECEDKEALATLLSEWTSGQRLMLEHDRGVLKRAMKAYRKRLKVTVLDAESTVGGGPMSAGRKSSIVGITPPERYPRAVWDELARQERLEHMGQGTYQLGPKA